jgi:hypothetical protein
MNNSQLVILLKQYERRVRNILSSTNEMTPQRITLDNIRKLDLEIQNDIAFLSGEILNSDKRSMAIAGTHAGGFHPAPSS